jgi:hypothetical protein
MAEKNNKRFMKMEISLASTEIDLCLTWHKATLDTRHRTKINKTKETPQKTKKN